MRIPYLLVPLVTALEVGVLYWEGDLPQPSDPATFASPVTSTLLALSTLPNVSPVLRIVNISDPNPYTSLSASLSEFVGMGIKTVFGGGDSQWRAQAQPVLKSANMTLWSPFSPEEECSSNLMFAGATIGQTAVRPLHWVVRKYPDAVFFLVYSEFTSSIASAHSNVVLGVIREELRWSGGQLLGNASEPEAVWSSPNPFLGTNLVAAISTAFQARNATQMFVISCLKHYQHGKLIEAMRANNLVTATGYNVLALGLNDQDAHSLNQSDLAVFATGSFFQELAKNSSVSAASQLVADYRNYTAASSDPILTDTVVAAYDSVFLWASPRVGGYSANFAGSASGPLRLQDAVVSRQVRVATLTPSGGLTVVYQTKALEQAVVFHHFVTPDITCTLSVGDGPQNRSTIKVGILHSVTGSLAISERAVVDAEVLAIEELNRKGGVLGRHVEPVFLDGESNWDLFTTYAGRLTARSDIASVFGCWTSASRKAVLPVFEAADKLLWYPVQYEGQECSDNVFYGGATPNQQIEPALEWMLYTLKPADQMYLVGSNYVFPRIANSIIRAYLDVQGCLVANEMYLDLGSQAVDGILLDIRTRMPNGGLIFNTLNGDSNVAFFRRMAFFNMTAAKYPTMSVSIAEPEVSSIGVNYMQGHYAVWNYFQTVDEHTPTSASGVFVSAFKDVYGPDYLVNDPMEAGYILVKIWSQAVRQAGISDVAEVRKAAYGQTYDAPEGFVTMNVNHHLSKSVRIGQVRGDGLFEIVHEVLDLVYPSPWNEYIPATKGLTCDWSNSAIGGSFKEPATRIALMHGFAQPYNQPERNVWRGGLLAARHVQEQHPGVFLDVVVMDDKGNASQALANLQAVMADPLVEAVFVSSDLHTEALPMLTSQESKLVLTIKPWLTPPPCQSHFMHFGLLPNQMIDPAMTYLSGAGFDRFHILLPSGPYEYFRSRLEPWAPNRTLIVSGVNASTDFHGLAQAVVGSCAPRCAVLNFLSGVVSKPFYDALVPFGGPSADFVVVNFMFGPSIIDYIGENALGSSLFLVSMVNPPLSSARQGLVAAIYNNFGPSADFSSQMDFFYEAIRTWTDAIGQEPNRIQQHIYLNSRLEVSNFASNSFYLGQISRDGTSLQIVYPTQFQAIVTPPEFPGQCNFGPATLLHMFEPAKQNAAIVMYVVVLAYLSGLSAFVYWKRLAKAVKALSVLFCQLSLVALCLLATGGILMAAEPINDHVCTARVWFLAMPLCLFCSFLFGKMYRLAVLFHSRVFSAAKVSDKKLLVINALSSAPLLLILIVWMAVDSPRAVQIRSPVDDTFDTFAYVPSCSDNNTFFGMIIVYLGLLLLLGLGIAYRARSVPRQFNESRSVGTCIVMILFLGCFFIPFKFLFATESITVHDANLLFLVNAMAVLFSVFVFASVLFIPVFLSIEDVELMFQKVGGRLSASSPGVTTTPTTNNIATGVSIDRTVSVTEKATTPDPHKMTPGMEMQQL